MGGNIDPHALLALLQGSQGNSQGINPPQQPSGQPDDYTNAVMGGGQDQSQQQPPQNNAQNAGPVKAGLRGVLSRMLGNFSYGAGQAMLKAAGDETDAEKATRLAQTAHLNAQTALTNAQATMMQNSVPFTLPNGTTVHLPAKMATDLMKQQIANQGKTDVANINKRFITTPAGLFDTSSRQLIQGTNAGITVTPEIAQQYGLSDDWIGKPMKLTDLASIERAGSQLAPQVTTTEHLEKDENGNLNRVTTTSTRKKIFGQPQPQATPGAATPGTPATPGAQTTPAPKLGNGVRPVIGPDGQPFKTASSADTVYATDPQSGQTIFTNRADAAAKGMTNLQKVTPVQRRKDESLSNRVADVQRKVGDYADTFSQPIDAQDKQAIAYLMQNPMPESIAHMGAIPLAGYANNLLQARGMQGLSENGMRRFIAFNQARESLSGYQQVLTNSSKSSDTILQLQLEQLPPPLADEQYANMATGEFQKNLDLAGQHIPIFPGSAETQQSIKAQQMAKRAQAQAIQNNQNNPQQYQQQHGTGEPPRPANVPSNYVFNAKGPQGAGWYKPKP